MSKVSQFEWRLRRAGSTVVVELIGDLDVAASDDLRRALLDIVVGQGNRHLAVDLGELAFIDTTGLAVLIETQRRVVERGGEVTLLYPRPQVSRVLDLTGLSAVMRVDDGAALFQRDGVTA